MFTRESKFQGFKGTRGKPPHIQQSAREPPSSVFRPLLGDCRPKREVFSGNSGSTEATVQGGVALRRGAARHTALALPRA